MLCFYAFPQCQGGVGLPLCYEDCMAIKLQFCFNDWALIEDNKVRQIYIRSRGHFRLPECEKLPKISKEKATCSLVSLTAVDPNLVTCELLKIFQFMLYSKFKIKYIFLYIF